MTGAADAGATVTLRAEVVSGVAQRLGLLTLDLMGAQADLALGAAREAALAEALETAQREAHHAALNARTEIDALTTERDALLARLRALDPPPATTGRTRPNGNGRVLGKDTGAAR